MTNSTSTHLCCDSQQINVLIASSILGSIFILITIFWILRQKFNYKPQERSLYQVL